MNFLKTFMLLSATLSASLTHAFTVSFYKSPYCAGESVNSYTGDLSNTSCRQDFVGEAGGAVVTKTGTLDDGAALAFYSTDDCDPDHLLSEADAGCISLSDFESDFRSFNVVGGVSQKRMKMRSAPDTQSLHPLDPVNDHLYERMYGEKLEASSDPGTLANARVREHGEVSDYLGQMYKWHQVAEGAWRGINVEEWDDDKHAINNTKLKDTHCLIRNNSSIQDARRLDSRKLSLTNFPNLEERDVLYGVRNFVRSCALTVLAGTQYTVSAVVSAFASKALQVSGTNNLWKFINQPLSSIRVSQCSSSKSDAETIASILKDFAESLSDRAFQATMEYNGVTGVISVGAAPTGQSGDRVTCGAVFD